MFWNKHKNDFNRIKKHCIVVCPQPLGGVPHEVTKLFSSSFLVAVDGGLKQCKRFKFLPHLWVGDGDSLDFNKWLLPYQSHLKTILLPRKKDYSDLDVALKFVGDAFLSKLWDGDLFLLGAQGGRLDHELIHFLIVQNWLEKLAKLLGPRQTPKVYSFGTKGIRVAWVNSTELIQPKGEIFSVFAFSKGVHVTIRGARYNLNKKHLNPGSKGLSNEGLGHKVTIQRHVKSKTSYAPVFLMYPFKGWMLPLLTELLDFS